MNSVTPPWPWNRFEAPHAVANCFAKCSKLSYYYQHAVPQNFVYTTHGLSKIASSPDLDGELVILCPKHSMTSFTVEDCDLAHLDNTVQRTLPLISTVLSVTEAITTSMSNAESPEKTVIRESDQDKITTILDLFSHHAGSAL